MSVTGSMDDADGEVTFAVYGDSVCLERDGACVLNLGPGMFAEFEERYSEAKREAFNRE